MAMCALVSARIRDGAVYNPRWDVSTLQEPSAEVFYKIAVKEAADLPVSMSLNTLRTHAVLALAAIQNGSIKDMHEHLGRYHTLVAVGGLHDEDNWPQGISRIETEERRRLFWSIYTLDIFSSIVWSGIVRSRESNSNVQYPAEIDDEDLNDYGEQPNARTTQPCWMTGRIFVLDLYRALEHVIMRLPARRARVRRMLPIHDLLEIETPLAENTVFQTVTQMYDSLPQCLKETPAVVCQPRQDRFGFQAADNIATVQLLRMVLLSAADASVLERCRVANEVVEAFMSIPTAYHSAISVPLLFHLGVIGQILGTALEQPLGRTEYRKVREVIGSLAELLSLLDDMHMVKGASGRLRELIERADTYWTLSRRQRLVPEQASGAAGSRRVTPQTQDYPVTTATTTFDGLFDPSLSVEAQSPWHLNLPQDLLEDFSQIFDFTQLSHDWTWPS